MGEVTYSARYTPWGDTLDTYGTGNFAFGYFGGLMDTATGLLYVGNGQYYDPEIGRFLTRNPNTTNNPYLPFDPTGALFVPLAFASLIYGKKKKKSKLDVLVIVALLSLSAGLGVAACGDGRPVNFTATGTVTPIPGGILGTGTAEFSNGTTATGSIVIPTSTPNNTPTPTCTPTLTPIPSTPTPFQKVEAVNLSAYYTVLESDYKGGKVPIKANAAKKQQIGADYLLKDDLHGYTNYEQYAQTARSDFLYDPAGLCTQGSGKLEKNNLYISCTDPVGNIPNVGFEWHSSIGEVAALDTVAICPHNNLTPFRKGDVIEIPDIKGRMQSKGKDEFFTVTDTGGGLCKTDGHAETLDVYLGEGYNSSTKADYDYIRNIDSTVVFIHRATLP